MPTTFTAATTEDLGITELPDWFHLNFGVNEEARLGFWNPEATYRYSKVLADEVEFADALVHAWGVTIAAAFGLLHTQAAKTTYGAVLAQAVAVADRLRAGVPVTIAETVGMELVQQLQMVVAIVERLGITSLFASDAIYGLSLSEQVRIAESLRNFFAGSISEGVGVASSFTLNRLTANSLIETIGVDDAPVPRLSLRVTAQDSVGLDDLDVLTMLYNGTIAEGIEISAAYLQPNGSILTWAVNTRTGAVTEYQNFEFTGFAKLGNTYVGGTADGLYELLGDTDDTVDIIPRIKGGFMQFGGSRLARLKEAYIGARGTEHFVLKIITGDEKTYIYEVDTQSMKTTKVNMGKGQRARYFAFELIGSGADFDLDAIEFVPIVVQRHV